MFPQKLGMPKWRYSKNEVSDFAILQSPDALHRSWASNIDSQLSAKQKESCWDQRGHSWYPKPGSWHRQTGDQSQTAQPRLPQTLDLHFGRGKLLTSRTSLFTKLWDKLKAKERGRIGLSLRDLKFLTSWLKPQAVVWGTMIFRCRCLF